MQEVLLTHQVSRYKKLEERDISGLGTALVWKFFWQNDGDNCCLLLCGRLYKRSMRQSGIHGGTPSQWTISTEESKTRRSEKKDVQRTTNPKAILPVLDVSKTNPARVVYQEYTKDPLIT